MLDYPCCMRLGVYSSTLVCGCAVASICGYVDIRVGRYVVRRYAAVGDVTFWCAATARLGGSYCFHILYR